MELSKTWTNGVFFLSGKGTETIHMANAKRLMFRAFIIINTHSPASVNNAPHLVSIKLFVSKYCSASCPPAGHHNHCGQKSSITQVLGWEASSSLQGCKRMTIAECWRPYSQFHWLANIHIQRGDKLGRKEWKKAICCSVWRRNEKWHIHVSFGPPRA